MSGILTSWTPSNHSIPVHADAILHKDAWIVTSQTTIIPPVSHPTITSTYEEYISTLPDWDKSLFDGLSMEVSCHDILARFQHTRKYNVQPGSAPYSLLVSDGSAGNNSMSFGWVLSMLDGTVLAKCSTPAPGHESSFQLEGYGMLPAARFLLHLFEYCQDTCAGPYKFITDNLGLIVRVRTSLKHTEPYPNSTLAPDGSLIFSAFCRASHTRRYDEK